MKKYFYFLLIFSLLFFSQCLAKEEKGMAEKLWESFISGLKNAWQGALEIWRKIWQFLKKIWLKIFDFFLKIGKRILEKIRKGLKIGEIFPLTRAFIFPKIN